jgi:hypothetical protein
MSKAIFDAEAANALLVPQTTIITTTTFPGLLVNPRQWGTTAWVLNISAITGTGTYVFVLEVSDLLGGTYSEVSRHTSPAGQSAGYQIALGVTATLAVMAPVIAAYARVRATLGGASPSVSLTSWLGKPAGHVGMIVRPRYTGAVI